MFQRLQLSPRIFLVSTALIAVVLAAIVVVPQRFSRQARLEVLRSHVGQVAELAASTVDADRHRLLLDPANYTPELYQQVLAPLVRFHSAYPDIFYVYTMVAREGQTLFVLDTATSPQLQTSRSLRASSYLEPFALRSEYRSNWLDELAAGRTWVTPSFQHDDYGYFLTGHSPLRDSQGRSAGFVGVDFNLDYYLAEEARFRGIEFASLAGALTVALILGFLFARNQYGLKDEVQRHYATSVQDDMTALLNRRGAVRAVATALAAQGAMSNATLLVDIDHFKSINDGQGHAAGDTVIAHLAAAIRQCARSQDVLARLGGDEFLIFLPGGDLDAATALAQRLLAEVRADNRITPFTVSIGISVDAHRDADFDAMYRRADAALYKAKAAGKDCFQVSCDG